MYMPHISRKQSVLSLLLSSKFEISTLFLIVKFCRKTTNSDVLDNYFTFLFLFVDAYHEQVTTQIKAIIPQLMDITLSRSLANVLKMIMMRIPKLRLNVQDGVMASVYQTLTGSLIPPKSEPIGRPASPKAILQVCFVEKFYNFARSNFFESEKHITFFK